MEFKVVKVHEQRQITISSADLIIAMGLDPEEWNIHSAFSGSFNHGYVTFGLSKKDNQEPFEMVIDKPKKLKESSPLADRRMIGFD